MDDIKSDFLDLCSSCDRKDETIFNKSWRFPPNESKIKCSRESRPKFCIKCFKNLNFSIKIGSNYEKINYLSVVEACEILDDELKSLENLQLNPIKFINDYFSYIINIIDIRREKIKLDIDNKSKLLLDKIKSYRLGCENLPNQDMKSDVNDIREKIVKWKTVLNNSNLDNKSLEYIKKDIELNLNLVRHKECCLKNDILIKKKFKFMDDNPIDKIESIFKGDFV